MTGSTAAWRFISRRDGFGDAAHLAGDPHPELFFVIVAAITLVDVDAAGLDPGELFQTGDDRPQRVAVERVAVQALRVQHKLGRLGAW